MKIQHEVQQRRKLLALLREVRQESRVRQVDLAEKLGVPQSFISKYEAGDRQLDVLELREVCRELGITLMDFVERLEETLNESQR